MDAWDGVAVVSPERGVIRRSYKSPTGGGQGSGGIKHKPITESLLMDDQGYGMQRRPKLIIVRDGETTGPKKNKLHLRTRKIFERAFASREGCPNLARAWPERMGRRRFEGGGGGGPLCLGLLARRGERRLAQKGRP